MIANTTTQIYGFPTINVVPARPDRVRLVFGVGVRGRVAVAEAPDDGSSVGHRTGGNGAFVQFMDAVVERRSGRRGVP